MERLIIAHGDQPSLDSSFSCCSICSTVPLMTLYSTLGMFYPHLSSLRTPARGAAGLALVAASVAGHDRAGAGMSDSVFRVPRWEWVVTKTILIADFAVPPVDYQLQSLTLGGWPGSVDRLSLRSMMRGVPSSPLPPNSPTIVSRHDMNITLRHAHLQKQINTVLPILGQRKSNSFLPRRLFERPFCLF